MYRSDQKIGRSNPQVNAGRAESTFLIEIRFPRARATAEQSLKHPWISSNDDDDDEVEPTDVHDEILDEKQEDGSSS